MSGVHRRRGRKKERKKSTGWWNGDEKAKELCFWNEKNRKNEKRLCEELCVEWIVLSFWWKEMQKYCSFDFIELLSVDLCFANSLYSFDKQYHWNWIRFFSWNEMKSISQQFTEWINYSFLFSITQKSENCNWMNHWF